MGPGSILADFAEKFKEFFCSLGRIGKDGCAENQIGEDENYRS